MAGLCAPLSTLRRHPRGYRRMTRGQCGSLDLHCKRLALSTPCRSSRRTENLILPPRGAEQAPAAIWAGFTLFRWYSSAGLGRRRMRLVAEHRHQNILHHLEHASTPNPARNEREEAENATPPPLSGVAVVPAPEGVRKRPIHPPVMTPSTSSITPRGPRWQTIR